MITCSLFFWTVAVNEQRILGSDRALTKLHCLPSPAFYATYNLAMSVYWCLRYRAPRYLAHCCVPVSEVSSRQYHRSASRRKLNILRFRRSTFGTWAFSVAGQTVWNSLPDLLHDLAVVSKRFKRDLKTHLFVGH